MIRRDTNNFTGCILQGNDEKVYFHADNKIFNFIVEGIGLFAEFSKKTLKSPDQFLYGYTTDGYQIALFTGWLEREYSANYKLKPGIYTVGRANACEYDMSKFQAIEFVGGTLNELYEQKRIDTKYDLENRCYVKTYPESKMEYQLKIRNYECKTVIKNTPSEENPSKMDLSIRYEFTEDMPLIEIKLIYNVLLDLCRLLCNRRNVGFDSVRLYQIDDETGKWLHYADGFIDYQYSEFTNKNYKQNILLDSLQDCMVNLHSVISSNEEGKATYLFDFYAENDADEYRLSDNKVKNICSSIECELDYTKDIEKEEDDNLLELIKQIKDIIKKHRKSEKKLEDKTYDNIGNSMSRWGMANSRRIYLLYLKNHEYIEIFEKRNHITCSEEDIAAFVKYRNDITHGRYRTMDSVIATTSYVLTALAYCCFFKRMGMRETELKKLLEENRIAW